MLRFLKKMVISVSDNCKTVSKPAISLLSVSVEVNNPNLLKNIVLYSDSKSFIKDSNIFSKGSASLING
ncbi:hypothetical protein D3C87_1841460 [compost metagenome]